MKLFIICYFCIGLTVYSVVGQPSSRNQDEWYKEQWPTQPYAFGYEIRDYSGNEQYRKEMSDGDRVTGSYGYLGPDGLYRHVEYIADENGFRAKIRTSEPGTSNDNPSNVQIESNPIPVLPNPSPIGAPDINPNPGGGYVSRNPNPGYRRDEVRPPPNRSTVNPNPNRSTYANPSPTQSSLPQIPNPSRGSNTPSERDRININRSPEISRPLSPDYIDPNLRASPIGPTRGGPLDGRDGVPVTDIPDNIIPYRGAQPQRPVIRDGPRGVSEPNQLDGQNIKPYFGRNPEIIEPNNRNPNYGRNPLTVRIPPPPAPIPPSEPSYDRNYDRSGLANRDPVFDSNRGPQFGGPDGRGYEVDYKGSTKIPPKDTGFIEATKGPIPSFRPVDRFYGKRPTAQFDDENEDYDQIKRRQDDDRSVGIINKPVFEDRDSPRKIGGFFRSGHNTTRPVVRDGIKTIGPTPAFRDSFNRTLNESSFDANEGRRDGYDKRLRRPTKVFVTNGPISGIADKRPDIKSTDRSFGAIDEQQRQQIDFDYEDKNTRDGQQIGLDGIKGRRDSDRLQPPIPDKGIEQPPQRVEIRPYFGLRKGVRDRSQDPLPPMRQHSEPKPRAPAPPYDPRLEQQHIQSPEDIPVQRDNEFPIDQQTVRPLRPQVFQPLRPNHRPDRQPSLPRRPDRPYKPRTQSQDRPYVEQNIEVQPYQTQSSATISSPINTIPTAYKPIDSLEEDKENDSKVKPSLNTPLSPSSYVITPFPAPVNETNIQIKPILEAPVYTVTPELTQMEIPKFGTRLRTPDPPALDSYEPIDEYYDDQKEEPQKDLNENINENDYQNQNQNTFSNDNQNEKSFDNLNTNPIANPLVLDNIENLDKDQYYSYYDDPIDERSDQTQDVESKDNPKNLIYSQSMSQRSDEKVDITSNSNSSLPIEIRHKVMKAINWHKFDTIDDSGRQTVRKPVAQVVS